MTDKERIEDIKKRWFEDDEQLSVKDISWLIYKVEKEAGEKEKWLHRKGYRFNDDGSYTFNYNNSQTHTFLPETVENMDVETLDFYHVTYLERMREEEFKKNG